MSRPLLPRPELSGRVLVVSSEPAQANALAQELRTTGYSPILAATGIDGYTALAELAATLQFVVLDDRLAGIEGWCLRELQMDAPAVAAIPIVVVASRPGAGDGASTVREGSAVPASDAVHAMRKQLLTTARATVFGRTRGVCEVVR